MAFFQRHLLQNAVHPGAHTEVLYLPDAESVQCPQPVDLGLLDRDLRIDGGNSQLQPLLLQGVPRVEFLFGSLRLLELDRRDESQFCEVLVCISLQTCVDELCFGRSERCLLLQQAALHLDSPIAVAGSRCIEIELRFERHLLEFGVVQLDDDGLRGDHGSRLDHDSLDVAVGSGRDPADPLGHERPCAANLADHWSTPDGVQVDGVAIDPGRGRLQARDRHRNQREHNDGQRDMEAPPDPLRAGDVRSGDVHESVVRTTTSLPARA